MQLADVNADLTRRYYNTMRDAAILTGRGAIPLLLEALTASLSSVSPRNRGPDAAQSTKDTGASSSAAHDMLLEQAEALIDMRAPLVWQIQKLSKAQVNGGTRVL